MSAGHCPLVEAIVDVCAENVALRATLQAIADYRDPADAGYAMRQTARLALRDLEQDTGHQHAVDGATAA